MTTTTMMMERLEQQRGFLVLSTTSSSLDSLLDIMSVLLLALRFLSSRILRRMLVLECS